MAVEDVTSWLEERKPGAYIAYEGVSEDGLHVWDLDFPESEHELRIGIVADLVDDEALLSERLMELQTQGWLDQTGEKDVWVVVGRAEIGKGPTWFG